MQFLLNPNNQSSGGGAIPTLQQVTDVGSTTTNDIIVPDEAYGAGWNGSMEVPTKNAIYDKIETLGVIIDAEVNILAMTPSENLIAWATDLNQLMVANGTNWYIDSSYLSLKLGVPDIGYKTDSNRLGYARDYITDKVIANSAIGGSSSTTAGGLRYNPIGLNSSPSIQAYYNSTWNNIVAGYNIQEVSGVIEHTPVGYTNRIAIYSGNSDLLGLNGLPITQGYNTSIGAYPVQSQVDGGSF